MSDYYDGYGTSEWSTGHDAFELYDALEYVPYPKEGTQAQKDRWKVDATEAGYPKCETCGNPIVWSHWKVSTSICNECWYKYERKHGFLRRSK